MANMQMVMVAVPGAPHTQGEDEEDDEEGLHDDEFDGEEMQLPAGMRMLAGGARASGLYGACVRACVQSSALLSLQWDSCSLLFPVCSLCACYV